jgi:hypothetical protein
MILISSIRFKSLNHRIHHACKAAGLQTIEDLRKAGPDWWEAQPGLGKMSWWAIVTACNEHTAVDGLDQEAFEEAWSAYLELISDSGQERAALALAVHTYLRAPRTIERACGQVFSSNDGFLQIERK